METVESLVSGVANSALSCAAAMSSNHSPHFQNITVSVAKPSALLFADSAEIQITRSMADVLALTPLPSSDSNPDSASHRAILALGSNLGDRVEHIEKALVFLEKRGVKILDTSFMYESAAMYVEEQPNFANAACMVIVFDLPLVRSHLTGSMFAPDRDCLGS